MSTDEEPVVVKNCGNCYSNKCHSCVEASASTTCEKCRYSVPARILSDDCNCPIGYYDGSSNYTCEKCYKLCLSCDNGTDCITCVISIPARIFSDKKCGCPIKHYDDGTNA